MHSNGIDNFNIIKLTIIIVKVKQPLLDQFRGGNNGRSNRLAALVEKSVRDVAINLSIHTVALTLQQCCVSGKWMCWVMFFLHELK